MRAAEQIDPIPFLAKLRDIVVERNPKRCPKWRFRIAPELVVQIQPRPTEHYAGARWFLFTCTALQGPEITEGQFGKNYVSAKTGQTRVSFYILSSEDGTQWECAHILAQVHDRWARPAPAGVGPELIHRVLAPFAHLEKLDTAMMFKSRCLICHKALTDPVSRARWVGPECYGKSSLDSVRHWLLTELLE